MKPLDYVKKYKLSETDVFSHKLFAIDFGNDFISRLEVYRTFSSYNLNKFFDLIDEMENRFSQIDKKTKGNLPEKLWYYMYDEIMIPNIDIEFPHIYEIKQKADKANINELKEMLAYEMCFGDYERRLILDDISFEWDIRYTDNSIGELGLKPNYDYKKLEKKIEDKNSYIINYIFDELTYKLKKSGLAKAKIQFNIHIKEKQRREKLFDWWNFITSQNLSVDKNTYIAYFSVLNLTLDATEEEVKKSFRNLSMTKHPDRGGNQEAFIELTESKNKCLEYLTIIKK